jgi:3,4-dihydroxy 2-butanone 4-phosphate synthase/GTP cyclohydrolase II
MALSSTQDLIADMRAGRMIIIMDDEDRENEGDFIVAAQLCTSEHVNFMTKHGRGLVCLTLTEDRCRRLHLPLMVHHTRYTHRTNFTVSIEAASGVTTGISAADRACTIRAAVAPEAAPHDLVQPGHIFPLMAQPGGVLTRAGHTEAGCDFARLAGFEPAAVIVEILNDDGTMARRPDLERIAAEHDLRIGTIADLIRFRIENEKTIERAADAVLPTEFGDFHLYAYADTIHGDLHMAMVKGDITPERATLVRVHIHNPFEDLTASIRKDTGWPLRDALKRVSEAGEGVVVVLSGQVEKDDLVREVMRYAESENGTRARRDLNPMDWRQIGLGAQILADLGVKKMRVMSNPRKYHAISGFGLEVVEYVT